MDKVTIHSGIDEWKILFYKIYNNAGKVPTVSVLSSIHKQISRYSAP